MNISQVVPLWEKVSPKLYWGTAQLVSSLNNLHRNPGGELAFLGRIAPEKRPDHAIEIAKGVRISLQISAKPIDWLSLPDPNPIPDPPLPPDPSPFPGPPFPEPVPPRPPNPSPVPGPPITIREATRSCPLSKRSARKRGVTMKINTGQRVPLLMTNAGVMNHSNLPHNLSVDICAVGAGMSGMTTAYLIPIPAASS